MHAYTWEGPAIFQIWTVNQTNQNDWPKETQKKCPIKVIQTAVRLWLSPSLSLSLPMCLSMHCFYCSVDNFCLSLWPMDCSMPGFPVHNQLLEFTQTHVHSVGDAIQSSHPLSSPSLPALNLSQHQGLFQWVGSSHHVAKVLKLQLQHHPIHPMNIRIDFNYTLLFLLINTLLISVLSIFVGILFCKAEGPGPLSLTIGLVARIWCFHCCDPATISWEPKPCSKPLPTKATRDHNDIC